LKVFVAGDLDRVKAREDLIWRRVRVYLRDLDRVAQTLSSCHR
jgi:hypothetical protein